jgi:hypothetical protein
VFGAIAEGRPDPRPPLAEVIRELEAFCDGIEGLLGPDRSCHYLRKFHSWYLTGRDVPDDELQALMEEPDLAQVRLRLARLRETAALAA